MQVTIYNKQKNENTWGLDTFGDIIMTSVTTSSTNSTETSSKADVDQAVGFDYNIYWYFKDNNNHDSKGNTFGIGPLAVVEALKPNKDAKELTMSYYGGLRTSYTSETFADVMFGKNEGTQGYRMKIRAQAPLYDVNVFGGYLLAGLELNRGIYNRPKNNLDSVKIYAMWKIPLSQLFSGITGSK